MPQVIYNSSQTPKTPRLLFLLTWQLSNKTISFSDHYNALLIERLSSKTKTGQDLWLFNNTLLQNKDFSSSISNLHSSLKRKQDNFSSLSDWLEYRKIKFKQTARRFSKNSTTQENIRISRLKKRL